MREAGGHGSCSLVEEVAVDMDLAAADLESIHGGRVDDRAAGDAGAPPCRDEVLAGEEEVGERC